MVSISRIAKTTLFALFWANFLNFFDRQVIAALAPMLKEYWQLSDYQVGLLATAFEITYALAPVPIAILADRWLRRRVVALSIAIWSGAMALTGVAGSFAMLLLSRAGLGLGEAGYGPSALAWLGDLFPSSHRSRAVGIHDLALMLGSAAGYALGGVLGHALGWRPVFYLAALPGLLLVVLVSLLPEPPKGQSDYQALGSEQVRREAKSRSVLSTLRELLTVPTLAVTYAAGVLLNFATAGLIYWLPSLAVRLYGISPDRAGLLTGAVTVMAGAAGVLAGGVLADRLTRHTPAGRLLTIGLGYLLGLPFALLATFAPSPAVFIALAALAVSFFAVYLPCIAPLVHQVTRPEQRATAMGLYLFVVHILGNATAPALIGWFSDRTGDLRLGLVAALLAALFGALLSLWGSRFVGPDTQKMLASLATDPKAVDSTS